MTSKTSRPRRIKGLNSVDILEQALKLLLSLVLAVIVDLATLPERMFSTALRSPGMQAVLRDLPLLSGRIDDHSHCFDRQEF